jgi:hypothetical protein
MVDRKFCRDCGDYRAVSEFTRNGRSRDGLAFYCKIHANERALRSRESRRTTPRVMRRPPEGTVIPDGHKWCPDCGDVLHLRHFVRSIASASGYSAYCKPCHNARSQASRTKVGGSRSYHLTRRYGMTAAEADHMLEQQGGLCAVCRTAPAQHVDHDHVNGAVRALLCFNCNGGLGQFRDDPELLRAAADYVEFHIARQGPAGSRADRPLRPGAPPAEDDRRPGSRRSDIGRRGRRSTDPTARSPSAADEGG